MPGRRLDPDERALWRKVTADVTPLAPGLAEPPDPEPVVRKSNEAVSRRRPGPGSGAGPEPRPSPGNASARAVADTLDGGWDRRLKRGLAAPDRTVDLHGHTLAAAHAAVEAALAHALADQARVLLVVTGNPPRPGGAARRGLIRAAIPDWLALSPHAARIAAVRGAHPRHGGAGALYVILRRRREGPGVPKPAG